MKSTARLARVFVLLSALVGTTAFAGAKQEQAPEVTAPGDGVLVVRVEPGSPAASAGIVRGDIILSVDGKSVNAGADIRAAVTARKPGDTVKVVVLHGDDQRTLSVKLGELSGQAYLGVYFEASAGVPSLGAQPDADSGATVVPGPRMMPGNGGQILAVTGAQIGTVTAGSPAEKAGLAAGDVITAVNGRDLGRGDDLAAIIGTYRPGDVVTLGVLGAKAGSSAVETREVKVTLGENPQDKAKPWLGVEYRMAMRVEGSTPWAGRLDVVLGVRVADVVAGGPAEKAGIAKGDLIATVDGRDVRLPAQVVEAISAHQPGDTVKLGVVKGGEGSVTEVSVTLASNPDGKGAAYLGVQLGGPWLSPGLPRGPGNNRAPGGRDGILPGGRSPGGVDA